MTLDYRCTQCGFLWHGGDKDDRPCPMCRQAGLETEIERLGDELADAVRNGEHMAQLVAHVDKPATCAVCDRLATCIGWCLDAGVQAMCDDHCGHGNEDSICYPVLPTRADVDRLRAIVDAIEELRKGEGDSLSIGHDTPDGAGLNATVTVYGDWCDTGRDYSYYGYTLAEALANAVAARQAAEKEG